MQIKTEIKILPPTPHSSGTEYEKKDHGSNLRDYLPILSDLTGGGGVAAQISCSTPTLWWLHRRKEDSPYSAFLIIPMTEKKCPSTFH